MDKFISIVLTIERDYKFLEKDILAVRQIASKKFNYFEINLCCYKESNILKTKINKIQQEHANINILDLPGFVDQSTFYGAILDNSLGDYIFIIESGIYDIKQTEELLKIPFSEIEFVYVENTFRKKFKVANLILKNSVALKYIPNYPFTGCLSRYAANLLSEQKERLRFIRYTDALFNLKSKKLLLKRRATKIKSPTNLKIVYDVTETILLLTNLPLKICSYISILFFLITLAFGVIRLNPILILISFVFLLISFHSVYMGLLSTNIFNQKNKSTNFIKGRVNYKGKNNVTD